MFLIILTSLIYAVVVLLLFTNLSDREKALRNSAAPLQFQRNQNFHFYLIFLILDLLHFVF